MQLQTIIYPLIGGALIGLSATFMLLFNGRVTGISGIIAASLSKPTQDTTWRILFLAGMVLAGIAIAGVQPELFMNTTSRSNDLIILAGLLVGYGTVMGSGCTSGHGICGISRFSIRSLLATLTFMTVGALTVQILRLLTQRSL